LNLTRNFVLDGLNVASVSQSNGDQLSALTGRAIDQTLAIVHSNGQVEYGLSDANNNTVATVDQTGKSVGTFFYEPFGQTTVIKSTYPFQYNGRIPINGGLYNFRARYYSTQLSRFLSEDPLGLASGDVNLYRFLKNSTPNFSDPRGTDTGGTPSGGSGCDDTSGLQDQIAALQAGLTTAQQQLQATIQPLQSAQFWLGVAEAIGSQSQITAAQVTLLAAQAQFDAAQQAVNRAQMVIDVLTNLMKAQNDACMCTIRNSH
jgi:RHS repeat-associated protein